LALADGVHPKIVQERLGHANISITLDIYSHVTAGPIPTQQTGSPDSSSGSGDSFG
jgi:site-specific recombinase XerD